MSSEKHMQMCIRDGCTRPAYSKTRNKDCCVCMSLWRSYRITGPERDQMVIDRDYKCDICKGEVSLITNSGTAYNKACVDHCHETGKVRGILCNACNIALGKFKDDIGNLKNAIEYLETTYELHNSRC